MTLRTAVLQFAPGEDKNDNLATIDRLLREAVKRGVSLSVLPEYAIYTVPTMDDRFVDHAEALDGPSCTRLRELSAELGISIIFGMNEVAPEPGRIYNTLVALKLGEIVGTYRKVHLYDAFGYKESDRVLAANPGTPELLEIDGFRIGMQTCYDLRFPEVSRTLVDAGANVIALPAEWVPGALKEYHWTTLIKARAIENTVYVLAADQSYPTGVGNSLIVDPMGIPLAQAGEGEAIGVAELDSNRLASSRTTNPALSLRRYRVVAGRPGESASER